ncbi:hypothetical protein CROQUDRAFT_97818 [Cronartium quercuum f. sp. fusiforme G11]|uniref:Uncharacterized protein n=1 Tax=Cronartium quercuum f. sp. fusiforme G11 TaxID=708437 RepID=A0A9P6N9R0_9BASI|nr:hypothetical protein CROQUDRAFT_97818 [Cronartium quercuum f. sp. fusiforme G11]
MENITYLTPEPERPVTSSLLQSSSPMIDFLNQVRPVESSPTAKFQSWPALLQTPEPFAQHPSTALESAFFHYDLNSQEYVASSLSNFQLPSNAQRKRSLDDAGICAEPHTPPTATHSSTSDSGAKRKKSRSEHSSPRPLPERHARKQNFACENIILDVSHFRTFPIGKYLDLCRKLKIKCVFSPGKEKCERCERGDVECLDGSSMRAAAAAIRAQQGLKKRRKRSLDSEKVNSDPEPLLISTKRIQTRSTPDVFQEVLDEPKSIGIGSVVQVKKSTQHHYMAKESVVTRVVCKVVAVYLDGSESDAIPVNLVRISEKQKNNMRVTELNPDHSVYDFSKASGGEWKGISQLPSVDYNPSEMLLPTGSHSKVVEDGIVNISTSNYPPSSAPLSLIPPVPNFNPSQESGLQMTGRSVLDSKGLVDPLQTMRLPALSIDTSLTSTPFMVESATNTPNTTFNSSTMCHTPLLITPTHDIPYGDMMCSQSMENFQLNTLPQTQNGTINGENEKLGGEFVFTTSDTVKSQTETCQSQQSSSPSNLTFENLSNLFDSNRISNNSPDLLEKLQDFLNHFLIQKSFDQFNSTLQSIKSTDKNIQEEDELSQVIMNESKSLTTSSMITPMTHNFDVIKTGYSYENFDSNNWS